MTILVGSSISDEFIILDVSFSNSDSEWILPALDM